jgi:hypothetical protein
LSPEYLAQPKEARRRAYPSVSKTFPPLFMGNHWTP